MRGLAIAGWLGVIAGCGASVELTGTPGDADVDASRIDAPPADALPDAPPDARACAGGDAAMAVADGTCLVRFDDPLTFADAMAACAAFDAQLAVLTTPERDQAAQALVGTANTWIGLSDQTIEGTFVWVDGTPLAFEDFATNEPNNANGQFQEDCAIWAPARPGWDDRPCAPITGVSTPGEYPYLCAF